MTISRFICRIPAIHLWGQSFWATAKCLIVVGNLDPFCLKPSCPEESIGNAASSNACWTWRKCQIWSDWPVALRIGKLVEPHHLGNIINSKCVQIPSKESSGRKKCGFEFWMDSGGCKHLTVCIFCSWSILLLLMELPSRHLYSCRTSESGRVRKRRTQSCRCDHLVQLAYFYPHLGHQSDDLQIYTIWRARHVFFLNVCLTSRRSREMVALITEYRDVRPEKIVWITGNYSSDHRFRPFHSVPRLRWQAFYHGPATWSLLGAQRQNQL